MLPPVLTQGGMPIDQIYAMFPNLKERAPSQGTRLSGGEQQSWPSRASCAPARACCCSTTYLRRPRAPSSLQKLAEMVVALRKQG